MIKGSAFLVSIGIAVTHNADIFAVANDFTRPSEVKTVSQEIAEIDAIIKKYNYGKSPCFSAECQKRKAEIAQEIAAALGAWNHIWLPQSHQALQALRRLQYYGPSERRGDGLDLLDEVTWRHFEKDLEEPPKTSFYLNLFLANEDAGSLLDLLWVNDGFELAWLETQMPFVREQKEYYLKTLEGQRGGQNEDQVSALEKRLQEMELRHYEIISQMLEASAEKRLPDRFYESTITTLARYLIAKSPQDAAPATARALTKRMLARLYDIRVASQASPTISLLKDSIFRQALTTAEVAIKHLKSQVNEFSQLQFGTLGLLDFYGPKNTCSRLEAELTTLEKEALMQTFADESISGASRIFAFSWGRQSLKWLGVMVLSPSPDLLQIHSGRSIYEWLTNAETIDPTKGPRRWQIIQAVFKDLKSLEQTRLHLLRAQRKTFVERKRMLEERGALPLEESHGGFHESQKVAK